MNTSKICSIHSFAENIWFGAGKCIVLLVIVQAWRIRAFEIPDAHQYNWNLNAVQEPLQKTFYVINTHALLFYRFNQSVQSPIRHLESVWCKKYFFGGGGLWNSSLEVLVILVRIRIFKSPIYSCLNYYWKYYGKMSFSALSETSAVYIFSVRRKTEFWVNILEKKLRSV